MCTVLFCRVNMVSHRMVFNQFNSLLTTQITPYPSNISPQCAVYPFPPVFRHEDYVVFAIMFHLSLALPLSHHGLLVELAGSWRPLFSARRNARGYSCLTAKGGGLPKLSYGLVHAGKLYF